MKCLNRFGSSLTFIYVVTLVSPARATVHVIDISNFFFSPLKTQVHYKDTVRWVWVGGFHGVQSDPSSAKSWSSGDFSAPKAFQIVINSTDGPGPFPYHCSVHTTSMKDTIFVASCCNLAGDADNSDDINIGDATFLIERIFLGGSAPVCNDEADANGDNGLNIGDVTFLIDRIFFGGGPPLCGTTGS